MRIFQFVFLSALVFLLAVPLFGADPNNCVAVRGVAQEHLLDFGNPDWQGGRPGDGWVGPVQLSLGNGEVLVGKVSENDGDSTPPPNGVGQGRGGSYFFDFGADGTFIVRYDNAVWPAFKKYAPAAFTGNFRSQGKIDVTNGTGRFVHATGNINTDGPFIAWNMESFPPSGRFNNSITGTMCDVLPKQ